MSHLHLLRVIYRPGFAYQKAGVILTNLLPEENRQPGLFVDGAALARSQALMAAMDKINQTVGSETVKLLAEGNDPRWAMRAERRTSRYTTNLEELAVAIAG